MRREEQILIIVNDEYYYKAAVRAAEKVRKRRSMTRSQKVDLGGRLLAADLGSPFTIVACKEVMDFILDDETASFSDI